MIHFPVGEGGREGRGAEWSPLSLARYSVKLAQCPALFSRQIKLIFCVCAGCNIGKGELLMPYFPPFAFDYEPETGLNREPNSGLHRFV